jgi:hypothetical protein
LSTPYHSQYCAYELTRRSASDDPAKLGRSLVSARVDLNPHQLDAALFAFRSPLSRGAILADEVRYQNINRLSLHGMWGC